MDFYEGMIGCNMTRQIRKLNDKKNELYDKEINRRTHIIIIKRRDKNILSNYPRD